VGRPTGRSKSRWAARISAHFTRSDSGVTSRAYVGTNPAPTRLVGNPSTSHEKCTAPIRTRTCSPPRSSCAGFTAASPTKTLPLRQCSVASVRVLNTRTHHKYLSIRMMQAPFSQAKLLPQSSTMMPSAGKTLPALGSNTRAS
jgi:hypothetical protein